MIVCNCNNIRERDLRDVARAGVKRAHHAYAALGGKVQCGQCLLFAREIIAEEHGAIRNSQPSPACQQPPSGVILPFPEKRLMSA